MSIKAHRPAGITESVRSALENSMLDFIKKLFSRDLSSQSIRTDEEAMAIMAVQEAVDAAKIPKAYNGPRNFANQKIIDQLLDRLRYQPLPALTGRAVLLNSLFTVNEDIQSALRHDYPFLGNKIESGFSDRSWYGSQVCPKYIHCDQLMEVDFETSLATCEAARVEDLDHLAFIDRTSDEWLHNENYTFEVFTLEDLCKHLNQGSGKIYMHLIIDNGNAFSREENATGEKMRAAITKKLKTFTDADYRNNNLPLWQAIVEVYNSEFFPAELIIREACLTNLVHDGSSTIYGHKYFYF
jgi:hypothetical protein